MSGQKFSKEQFKKKLEAEKGLYNLAVNYGLYPELIEDPTLKSKYKKFFDAAQKLSELEAEVLNLLPKTPVIGGING